MRHVALFLLLALSACGENLPHEPPPMDHFFYPSGLALTTPAAGGNQVLLVASANFDLRYDTESGATLLSVDPALYDPVAGTGSAGRPDGGLARLGAGARLGSYAGPVTVADGRTCPNWQAGRAAEAFVASRYTRKLYRFPLGDLGEVDGCASGPCRLETDADFLDPAAIGLVCRADVNRRSLLLGYLRSPGLGGFPAGTAWLSEYSLDALGKPPRTFALGSGPVADMAYDETTDRLYAVGRFAGLTAPLFVINLAPCAFDPDKDLQDPPACPTPRVQVVDLYPSLRGAELVGIALSHPKPGQPRLAYVSARVYDESYALALYGRPPYDVGGALLVVELQEGVAGDFSGRVRQVVPIGLGAGSVRVLPERAGLGDVVVVTSSGDGTLHVYDGEIEDVVRVITANQDTGAPETGRIPSAMAVEDRGAEALVYVASFRDSTVSVLRVPLAAPYLADLLRHPQDGTPLAGTPIRIGSPQP